MKFQFQRKHYKLAMWVVGALLVLGAGVYIYFAKYSADTTVNAPGYQTISSSTLVKMKQYLKVSVDAHQQNIDTIISLFDKYNTVATKTANITDPAVQSYIASLKTVDFSSANLNNSGQAGVITNLPDILWIAGLNVEATSLPSLHSFLADQLIQETLKKEKTVHQLAEASMVDESSLDQTVDPSAATPAQKAEVAAVAESQVAVELSNPTAYPTGLLDFKAMHNAVKIFVTTDSYGNISVGDPAQVIASMDSPDQDNIPNHNLRLQYRAVMGVDVNLQDVGAPSADLPDGLPDPTIPITPTPTTANPTTPITIAPTPVVVVPGETQRELAQNMSASKIKANADAIKSGQNTGVTKTLEDYAMARALEIWKVDPEMAAFYVATQWGVNPSDVGDLYSSVYNAAHQADANQPAGSVPANADVLVGNVVSLAQKMYSTSIGMNNTTGTITYNTKIIDPSGKSAGYFSFDPVSKQFDAQFIRDVGSKKVTLYSDPRNSIVYVSVGNADNTALKKIGVLKLMDVEIGTNGKIGGSFTLGNRLFNYNPATSAFEIPISMTASGKIAFMSNGDGTANRGSIIIDTKGNVRGSLKLFGSSTSTSQGSLFLDSSGNIALNMNLRSTATSTTAARDIASISIGTGGDIGGTVNIGKVIGISANAFVSFSKDGITGVAVPIGHLLGGPAFAISYGKNGLSFGGFIPIAGLPIPVSLGADAHGNVRLTWPGGSLALFGHEDRPLTPPAPVIDTATNMIDASCIYYRHSFKKGVFGTTTVRVYQTPCTKIVVDEQKAHGDIIFQKFNQYLGRNPSVEEFMNWYFYNGHMGYNYPQHETDKAYRISALTANLDNVLGKSANWESISSFYNATTIKEAQCVKSRLGPNNATASTTSKLLSIIGNISNNTTTNSTTTNSTTTTASGTTDCKPPEDILQINPFSGTLEASATPSADDKTRTSEMQALYDAIANAAANDPLWKGNGYVTGALFDGGTITDAAGNSVGAANTGATSQAPLIETNMVMQKGYNTLVVSDKDKSISVKPFIADGLTIFQYNVDGSKQWKNLSSSSDTATLDSGTSYYVYNPGNIVQVTKTVVANSTVTSTLHHGWNLIANSSATDETLDLLISQTQKADVSCLTTDCFEKKSLKDLFTNIGGKRRAYEYIYLVTDSTATDSTKAFNTLKIADDNIATEKIFSGRSFWVYLK